MKLVNFTQENLSKIHISQFEQFLMNHNIKKREYSEIKYLTENNIKGNYFKRDLGDNRYHISISLEAFPSFTFQSGYLEMRGNDKDSHDVFCSNFYPWTGLLLYIYQEKYLLEDLTQFHELFTELYNEIMSYPINEREITKNDNNL